VRAFLAKYYREEANAGGQLSLPMDVDVTNVLNVQEARSDRDEKHMAPLQLDVIERAVKLWSNPGDVVFTPFLGIGSECVGAVEYGRRAVGIELKPEYFATAVKNLENAGRQGLLFA
jgi:DNA modification methylase